MNLSKATIDLNLSATVLPSQQGVSGSQRIGKRLSRVFDAEVAYSCRISVREVPVSGTAPLLFENGAVVLPSSQYLVTDGDGKDLEGNLLFPSGYFAGPLAVLVVAGDENVGIVDVLSMGEDSSVLLAAPTCRLKSGGFVLLANPAVNQIIWNSGVQITMTDLNDYVEIFVFAKSIQD